MTTIHFGGSPTFKGQSSSSKAAPTSDVFQQELERFQDYDLKPTKAKPNTSVTQLLKKAKVDNVTSDGVIFSFARTTKEGKDLTTRAEGKQISKLLNAEMNRTKYIIDKLM